MIAVSDIITTQPGPCQRRDCHAGLRCTTGGDKRDTPGILVLQDQFGVTDFLRDTANRFVRLGFTAIAPALYHRTGIFEMPYAGRLRSKQSTS